MYEEGEMAVFFLLFQPAFLSLQFAMFLRLTVLSFFLFLSFAMFLPSLYKAFSLSLSSAYDNDDVIAIARGATESA